MSKIQRLSEKDYNDIFSLSQYAFQYELSEEDLMKKQEEAKRHIIWGWQEEGKLAAKLHLIPLSSYINGKEMKMGGISSVATWPEYRRKGMVKHLLYHALQHMKENGQVLSFLHPFSFSFYRKYGFEYAFAEKHYTLPIEKLKKKWKTDGYVRRTDNDLSLLQQLYTDYAKNYTGMLVRDEKWWKQRVLTGKYNLAVAYNSDGQAIGYLMFEMKNKVFTVKEMVHHNPNGLKLLLEFISNHDSMVDKVEFVLPEDDLIPLLVDEPNFDQKIIPYFMARIVDVEAFLKDYPFNAIEDSFSLTFTVEDNFFPDNSGTYQLHQTNGTPDVTFIDSYKEEETLHCSIQILTAMFLGFKRPADYYQAGLLQGNEKTIEKLEKIIPVNQTFLADFF